MRWELWLWILKDVFVPQQREVPQQQAAWNVN